MARSSALAPRLALALAAVAAVRTISPTFAGVRGAVAPQPRCLVAVRVAEGDMLPDVEVEENFGEKMSILDLFKGKKGILFAVPGAFTPTCSEKHLPGYIEGAEELKAAGAEVVACVAVNDAFVMKAWGKQQETEGKVTMLADAGCQLTKALDMELDAADKLGNVRSKRYAMIVDDGKITKIGMDDDSFAPEMLAAMK